jgi:hypothetical protein
MSTPNNRFVATPELRHVAISYAKVLLAVGRAWILPPSAPPFCAPQVELLDLGSPFARKPNVVAYERHVFFASDDPADPTRHRAPCPIRTARIDGAFVHETSGQLVGLVFALACALAYACDLGIGVYLVPSTFALVDSPEHRFPLAVGKPLLRHAVPFIRSTLPCREGYQRVTQLFTRRAPSLAVRSRRPRSTRGSPKLMASVKAPCARYTDPAESSTRILKRRRRRGPDGEVDIKFAQIVCPNGTV